MEEARRACEREGRDIGKGEPKMEGSDEGRNR